MFAPVGEEIHVVGPVPGGMLACAVFRPDGSWKMGGLRDNPFSAEAAKLN